MSIEGRSAKKVQDLKRRRAGLKSGVTKCINDIWQLAVEKEETLGHGRELFDTKLSGLDKILNDVEDNHRALVRLLTEREIREAEAYVNAIRKEIDEVKQHVATVLRSEADSDLRPEDSVRQAGSRNTRASSISSTRASATAASLAVAAESLREMQQLELEELALVSAQLAAANAEKIVYDRIEAESQVSLKLPSRRSSQVGAINNNGVQLDPAATTWVQPTSVNSIQPK